MPETTPRLGLSKPVLATDLFEQMIDGLRSNADLLDAKMPTLDASGLVEQDSAYTSGVSGFTPTSVKAALDALAGVRIVEKGTNANGWYIRWENGWQIVFGRVQGTSRDSAGNYIDNVVMAAAFYNSEYVALANVGERSYAQFAQLGLVIYTTKDITLIDTSTIQVRYHLEFGAGMLVPVWITYLALGRWK